MGFLKHLADLFGSEDSLIPNAMDQPGDRCSRFFYNSNLTIPSRLKPLSQGSPAYSQVSPWRSWVLSWENHAKLSERERDVLSCVKNRLKI